MVNAEDVWLFAGDDDGDLRDAMRRMERMRAVGATPGADSGIGELQGRQRLAIVAPEARTVALAERIIADGKRWSGRGGVWFSPDPLAWDGGRTAFLFPGIEPSFVTDAMAVAGLADTFGQPSPELTNATIARQAASLVRLGTLLDRVLADLGYAADEVGGHSVGEWTAAVASGMVRFGDAEAFIAALDLDSIVERLPDVEYFATTAGAEDVMSVIGAIEGVTLSHDNCPRQSIVCGAPDRLVEARAALRAAGIRGGNLGIRSGFHSPALGPGLEEIGGLIDSLTLRPRRVPLWSATVAGLLPSGTDSAKEVMLRHVVEPVRFTPMIREMHDDGVRIFVQLGVGSLMGFVEDTLRGRPHLALPTLDGSRTALAQLRRVVAALWVEGVEPVSGVRDALARTVPLAAG